MAAEVEAAELVDTALLSPGVAFVELEAIPFATLCPFAGGLSVAVGTAAGVASGALLGSKAGSTGVSPDMIVDAEQQHFHTLRLLPLERMHCTKSDCII